jgi:glycosyltransferase involved in cell wall biosynthesis
LPVIANDSGGTRELVIDGRTGLLLPRCDPAEIAAALASVIGDPALAQQLSVSGRRHVRERFPMTRMAKSYLEVLRSPQRRAPC